MLEFRLNALESFLEKPTPTWGGDLSGMDYDDIYYYIRPMENQGRSWDDVPDDIKNTFEKLGIPQAERESLAVGAQYESEVVYHSLKKELEEQGVIFLDMDSGLREHEDIVEEYFGTIIPPDDNKFAALNSAVWSGGSFVYIPPGVSVDIPLQAYFRINAENMGQFERTLIIADEDSYVHYIELHGPDVYHELAALGGGRVDRQAGGAHPLLDHPELVAQHLQPGDQAGRGPRERHHRVGGRQPGLQADHEVPGGVPGRRGRAR